MYYKRIIEEVQMNPSRTVDLMKEHLDSRANSNLGINLQAMLDEKFNSLSNEIRRSHKALEEQEEQESNENGEE